MVNDASIRNQADWPIRLREILFVMIHSKRMEDAGRDIVGVNIGLFSWLFAADIGGPD